MRPAWTLVFTSPYKKSWSFITEEGYVPWRQYLGLGQEDIYEGD